MRLIDAYALIEELKWCKGQSTDKDAWNDIIERVTKQPTVDAVPVVRCRDCKHWDKGSTEECTNSDSICFHNGWCKPNWFCADGERRNDDD